MDHLLHYARQVSRAGAWFGGGLLILAAFVIGVDVVIRKLFNATIGGADELSGYALAIGSAWSFAFALTERAHVRIDSLYVTLPARICALLDILGLTVFVLFLGMVTYYGYGVLWNTIEFDAHSMSPIATPLIYPQTLWVIGLSLFVLVALLLLARAVIAFVSGDITTVARLVGSRTISQEIEQELRGTEDEA
ncbi:MAG: TRAP transporter small permease subunit [Alphaproteobacteria bacterium]|nr:TRAP transporter small permease subunit [Alphaproteobacteria bacterium]